MSEVQNLVEELYDLINLYFSESDSNNIEAIDAEFQSKMKTFLITSDPEYMQNAAVA